MTRRGLAIGGASVLAGLGAWRWLVTRSQADGLPWPLRRVLEGNERLARATFGPARPAPAFPAGRARWPRVNGRYGLRGAIDPAAWRLRVVGAGGKSAEFTMDDIKALPRAEQVTELKCIEGWSTVVRWAGARLVDLAAETGLAARDGRPFRLGADPGGLLDYAALATPDRQYYVGLEMASALHPQTLLCYEMNGLPLADLHGAPLRLVIPVKYGIKNLKRVGTLAFTDRRPADFWAERGYDWYAGH